MSVISEFKDFIVKGNPIDLAVGVLIGSSFGTVVKAVTDGLVNPVISSLGGNPNISLKLGIFDAGLIVNALTGLLITGAILFFVFIKPMNHLRARAAAKAAPPTPAGPTQEQLLAEIRDLLKAKAGE